MIIGVGDKLILRRIARALGMVRAYVGVYLATFMNASTFEKN